MFLDICLEDILINLMPFLDSQNIVYLSQTGSMIYGMVHSLLSYLYKSYIQSHQFQPIIQNYFRSLSLDHEKKNRFFIYFVVTELSSIQLPKFQECLFQIYMKTLEIKSLNLYGYQIGNEGLLKLSMAIKIMKVNLHCLNLGNNNIDSHGIPYLCSYIQKNHHQLEILSLNYNRIDQKGIYDLTHCLLHPSLKMTSISISDNPINDQAAQILSDFLENPLSSSLNFLCLCRTEITCYGKISVSKSWGVRKPIGLFI